MAKEPVFAVIGLGTFGKKVCEILSEKGGRVLAIDNDPRTIEAVKNDVTQAVLLDSTDEDSLSSVPLEDVDVAVVAIGDNIESSILTTALLKRAGVPYIVARGISDIHQQVLRQVGADETLNIEIEQGRRLALKLISPDVLDRVPITKTISIAEIYAPESFVGKPLSMLDLRRKARITVVAIKRTILSIDGGGNAVKKEDILFPGPDDRIEESDILMVVGKNEDIDNLKEF
jgi:trk system potassium uptake protein TrkA